MAQTSLITSANGAVMWHSSSAGETPTFVIPATGDLTQELKVDRCVEGMPPTNASLESAILQKAQSLPWDVDYAAQTNMRKTDQVETQHKITKIVTNGRISESFLSNSHS